MYRLYLIISTIARNQLNGSRIDSGIACLRWPTFRRQQGLTTFALIAGEYNAKTPALSPCNEEGEKGCLVTLMMWKFLALAVPPLLMMFGFANRRWCLNLFKTHRVEVWIGNMVRFLSFVPEHETQGGTTGEELQNKSKTWKRHHYFVPQLLWSFRGCCCFLGCWLCWCSLFFPFNIFFIDSSELRDPLFIFEDNEVSFPNLTEQGCPTDGYNHRKIWAKDGSGNPCPFSSKLPGIHCCSWLG